MLLTVKLKAEMELPLLRAFQSQIQIQAKGALLCYSAALNELDAARASSSDPAHRIDMDWFWVNVQGCLGAVANISKACWGSSNKDVDRAVLRASLGLGDESSLRDKSMRNRFEHLDEHLEKWWKQSSAPHNFVDLTIAPSGEVPVDDADIMRLYDPRTHEVVFLGSRYSLKEIMPEVQDLWIVATREAAKSPWVGEAAVRPGRRT